MTQDTAPLVTLITPSFNQGEFLEATIRSVLEQDYPNIEYMVIDGGSTDASVEIIRRYADRLAHWESQPDRGQAHAINKGLQRAKGEILGWLNADDLLLPGTVRMVVDSFRQHPEVDVIYGRLVRIDPAGRLVPTPLLPKDRVVFGKETLIGECVVNQPGSFWRRGIMEKTGLLNENLHYALDYEYWVRMFLAGGRFKRLSEPVAAFRLSPNSKTVGQTGKAAKEHLRVIDELLALPELKARTGLSPGELARQARRGRGVVRMYAFYGSAKSRSWGEAARWLISACAADPLVPFRRRWFDLLLARVRRKGLK